MSRHIKRQNTVAAIIDEMKAWTWHEEPEEEQEQEAGEPINDICCHTLCLICDSNSNRNVGELNS